VYNTGAGEPPRRAFEGGAGAAPAGTDVRRERGQRVEAPVAGGAKGPSDVDAQAGVSA
jgi:hypothetical protein